MFRICHYGLNELRGSVNLGEVDFVVVVDFVLWSRSVLPYCDGGYSSVSIQELRSPFIYPERINKSFLKLYTVHSACVELHVDKCEVMKI